MGGIKRNLASLIAEDFKDIEAVFINGPRQAGKSTFAQDFARDHFHGFGKARKAVYASFDDITLRAAETASPGQIFADITDGLVILDEIQYVPQTFLALKEKIDTVRRKKQRVKFLLTGSADLMLLPNLSSALVGRMYVRTLYPFSAAEVYKTQGRFVRTSFKTHPSVYAVYSKPNAAAVISKAGFPRLSLKVKNKAAWFQNYISTLIDRDIKNYSEIDRIELMPQLLSVLAHRTGGLLNDADLAASLKLSQPTIKRYRTLLNGVFLSFLLPPWHKNMEKRLVKSPKIYFTDTMLLCHLLGCLPGEVRTKLPVLYGFVLENFAASELLKELSLMNGYRLYHFRTSDQKEVDFLAEAPDGKILAIEVKASTHVTPGDFKHIAFLQNALGSAFVRGIILYQGDRVIRFEKNLYAMPFSALWETA